MYVIKNTDHKVHVYDQKTEQWVDTMDTDRCILIYPTPRI